MTIPTSERVRRASPDVSVPTAYDPNHNHEWQLLAGPGPSYDINQLQSDGSPPIVVLSTS